eukprot:gene11361-biopygen18388
MSKMLGGWVAIVFAEFQSRARRAGTKANADRTRAGRGPHDRGQRNGCGPDAGSAPGLGETATPASGPRPVRVRFFKFYRAPRVRSASGTCPLQFSPGLSHCVHICSE